MSVGYVRSSPVPGNRRLVGGVVQHAARAAFVVALGTLPALAPRAQLVADFEDVHGPCCIDDKVTGPTIVVDGPVTVTSPGATVAFGTALTGLGSDGLRVLASNGGTTLQFATPITDLWLRCFRSSTIVGPAVYEVTGMGAPFTFSLPNGIIVPLHWTSAAPTTSVKIELVIGGLNAVHVTIDDLRTLPLPPGCEAWWSMEPSTSGLLEDTIGYHDGTLLPGASLQPGGGGYVLETDGVGGVVVPDDDALDLGPPGPGDIGDLSLTCWFRSDSSGVIGLFSKYGPGPDVAAGWSLWVYMESSSVEMYMTKAQLAWDADYHPGGPTYGTWHHAAVTIDRGSSTGLSMYMDGVLLLNADAEFIEYTGVDNDFPLRIHHFFTTPGKQVDDAAIFRRVLTPAEVAALAAVPPLPDSPWGEVGHALAGTSGKPCLAGAGNLIDGSDASLRLVRAKPDAMATLVLGLNRIDQSFKGGVMVPSPDILIPGLPVDGFGTLTLAATFPPGVPAGLPIYFQYWIPDPAGPAGYSASTAVQGITE